MSGEQSLGVESPVAELADKGSRAGCMTARDVNLQGALSPENLTAVLAAKAAASIVSVRQANVPSQGFSAWKCVSTFIADLVSETNLRRRLAAVLGPLSGQGVDLSWNSGGSESVEASEMCLDPEGVVAGEGAKMADADGAAEKSSRHRLWSADEGDPVHAGHMTEECVVVEIISATIAGNAAISRSGWSFWLALSSRPSHRLHYPVLG